MNRTRTIIAGAAIAAVALAGCSQNASTADLKQPKITGRVLPKHYQARVPDSLTVYMNIDLHPNIAKVCIEGVGFATTSRDLNAMMRVPEWDASCRKVAK